MLIVALILLGAAVLFFVSLHKTYNHLPRPELKRRAKSGDELAAVLYRVAAYENTSDILLWASIGLFLGLFFIVLAAAVPAWLALVVSVALIWLSFAWLPYTRVSTLSVYAAKWTAQPLAWVLHKTYPVLRWFDGKTGKYRVNLHTGIYEKDDILALLDRQKTQLDSRLSEQELYIARHALSFGDKKIRDIMTPLKIAKTVASNDSVGPVLLDELHKSGHSRFPVHEGSANRFVGTLYLRDLVDVKTGGQVRDYMQKKVYYMHDEEQLDKAVQAFLKTHHHLFVVVNSFEDVIGVVSFEDVLEQIIGNPIVDEFDKYDDLRAVAQRQAASEHEQHKEEVVE